MTTLRRVLFVASLLIVAGTCLADQAGLKPRQVVPKTPTVALKLPEAATGRLVVKFADELKARPTVSGEVRSEASADLSRIQAVLQKYYLKARPLFNHPDPVLKSLEARAASISGKAQPDLAGMMYVDGSRRVLLQAARALNNLEEVEYVEFEVTPRPTQEDPDCGTGDWDDTLSCFIDNNNTPFCNDEDCCREICDNIDPYCCQEDDDSVGVWDYVCAAYANLICVTGDYDRCASPMNGSCFEPHIFAGCRNETCCNIICADDIDPTCCQASWDLICVFLAESLCQDDGGGPTPDFEDLQAYKIGASWRAEGIPAELAPFVPLVGGVSFYTGYDGEGWNMQDPNDPYGGLHGLAEELMDEYGVGDENMSYGSSIKVGVIGSSFYGPEPYEDDNGNGQWDAGESYSDLNNDGEYSRGHEDLRQVRVEEGQTLIQVPELTFPNHGTAVLSIIDAADNGKGVTGIAPDCESWYFPITSVEEGPRNSTAWASAMSVLDIGDVICATYFPPGDARNLNNAQASWTLIRMAADLGITCVIAAGNECANLDEAPDLGDAGSLVVGACSPGFPFYRLPQSNFGTTSTIAVSNTVHIKAWGDVVVAAGYGDLHWTGDPLRSYTASFGLTSAAAPQIAGLVACLQGFAKQYYGIPLMPEQIRAVLGVPADIPDPSRTLFIGGFGDTADCGYDVDPNEGPNWIGHYPDVVTCASRLITGSEHDEWTGFNGSPLIDEIGILRGEHIYGNTFSVKESENSYLIVRSLFTQPGDGPSGGGEPGSQHSPFSGSSGFSGSGPGSEVGYYGSGQVVDLMAIGHSDIDVVNSLRVTTELGYPGNITVLLVEIYNWDIMAWQFISAELMSAGDDDSDNTYAQVATYANRFVRPSDDKVFIRFWTLGLTGGMQGDGDLGGIYDLKTDWVNLEVSEDFDAFVDDGGA